MNIQNFYCQNPKENWLYLLNKKCYSNLAYYQGNTYLYVNSEGQINHFLSSDEAAEKQFNLMLTIEDIVELSKKYFPNYEHCTTQELQMLRHVFKFIYKGIDSSHTLKFLIDEQLSLLIEQKIHSQFCLLEKTLRSFKELVNELDDKRFDESYSNSREKQWRVKKSFQEKRPSCYEKWREQKKQLTSILYELQKLVYFSERILSIGKQKIILYHLMRLDSKAAVKEETVEQIECSLNELIDQKLSKFNCDNDEAYLRQLDLLDAELDKWQHFVLQNCTTQNSDQDDLIQRITSNQYPVKVSPLKNFFSFCKQMDCISLLS